MTAWLVAACALLLFATGVIIWQDRIIRRLRAQNRLLLNAMAIRKPRGVIPIARGGLQ